MSRNENHFVLSEADAKRHMTMGEPLICHKCQRLIQIRDKAVAKRRSGRQLSYTKYYHEKCWTSLFYESRAFR